MQNLKHNSDYFLEQIESLKNGLSNLEEISKNLLVFSHESAEASEEGESWRYDASVATAKIQAVKNMFSEREATLNKMLDFYIDEYNRQKKNA